MLVLYETLTRNVELIEYLYDQHFAKTIVFPSGQRSFSLIRHNYNGVVPHSIIMNVVDQQANNGAYNRNPNYFQQTAITYFIVHLTKNCLSNNRCSFSRECTQAFHKILSELRRRNASHLITGHNFPAGRTIFTIDTLTTHSDDVVEWERRANIRITLNFETTYKK